MIRWTALILLFFLCHSVPLSAQEPESSEPPQEPLEENMSLERMEDILRALDPEIETNNNSFLITVSEVQLFVITDTGSDRMRVMAPIRSGDEIAPAEISRMMQANFDSALDARYAFGRGMLWSVYIHPLSPLQKNQLISGIGQVVNLVRTYGTFYTGGVLNYGGGDSAGINRKLIEDLLKKGESI